MAYACHYSLIMTPDDIWTCVIQALAIHINENSEKMRHHFVNHEGKKEIEVVRNMFTKGQWNPWENVFDEFGENIKNLTDSDIHALVCAKYSTTQPIHTAVYNVSLMATMKDYFTYVVSTKCGIPSITIKGTLDDWKTMRTRAERILKFDFEWWSDDLLSFIDEFISVKQGKINLSFWQNFCKERSMGSGTNLISGNINMLFPYLKDYHEKYYKNLDFQGVSLDSFPNSMVIVPFIWRYYSDVFDMEFQAGTVGVSQNVKTGAVSVAYGWVVDEVKK